MSEGAHDTASIRAAPDGSSRSFVAHEEDELVWAVRRLTPLECEKLQGFPDDYTDVPYRRRNWTPDGPRYKALGNSMAVNVMGWLGGEDRCGQGRTEPESFRLISYSVALRSPPGNQ